MAPTRPNEASGPSITKVQVRPSMPTTSSPTMAGTKQATPPKLGALVRSNSVKEMMARAAKSKMMHAKLEARLGGTKRHVKYNDLQARSLGCLTQQNPIRRFCVNIIKSPWFDRFIVLMVLANTLILSLVDYSEPWESGPNPTKLGNIIVARANDIALLIFSAEAVVKIIALGVTGPYSYSLDNWNKLDAIVVLTGLASKILESLERDSVVGLTQLRMLRILRPLRTLHSLPGLKVLANSVLSSLPALFNVTILLGFSYLVFAILGMDIWAGSYHGRCRLTEFPVQLNFNASAAPINFTYPNQTWIDTVVKDPAVYRCVDMANDSPDWTPQNCFWPLDPADTVGLYCGSRECSPGTFCGSNYDVNGQPRFLDIFVNTTTPSTAPAFSIMTEPDFTPNLNFGLTSFDNVGSAMIIILQVVTASGWMVITQNTQDCLSSVLGGIYFNLALFIGMCFLLQLNMAVVYFEYQKAKEMQELVRLGSIPPAFRRQATMITRKESIDNFFKTQKFTEAKTLRRENSTHAIGRTAISLRKVLLSIALSKWFQTMATCVTAVNVLLLCSDHYPSEPSFDHWSEVLNAVCLAYFIFEMTVKLVAGGARSYLGDKFNLFDLLTIVAGIVEFFIDPPRFIDGTPGNTSPIATFRLIRALKFVRSWKSLNRLMVAIMDAMSEILNFLFFLFMFIYIYALLGMELFATKFHFDGDSRPLPFNNTNPTATLRRTNFDSIRQAVMAVFQVITYDEWPSVMYDGWLSTGAIAPVYFISIVVFGVWIIMSMFCAIMVDSVMEGVGDVNDDDARSLVPSLAVIRLKRAMRMVLAITKFRRNAIVPTSVRASVKKLHTSRSLGLFSYTNPIRKACVAAIVHPLWNKAMFGSIGVSCIFTAIDSPLQDTAVGVGLLVEIANKLFAVLFAFEMVVTVVALGLVVGRRTYLRDPWRVLDFFIVIVSLLSWAIGNDAGGALSGLRSLRSLRALRPLRVINKLPQLKVVVNTLFQCLPDIGRSLVFFFFMQLLFAVPGVIFFKGSLNTCSISPYQYLDHPTFSPPPPWFPSNYSGNYTMAELQVVDIMTFPTNWSLLDPSIQALLASTCNMTEASLAEQQFVPTSKQICTCFSPQTSWSPLVPQRFDNIAESMMSFFELTTFEGWTNVANACIDATGPDTQPLANHQPWFMLYWIVFMIVGAFFVTNMFIAVLCDAFMREKYGVMVTDEQIDWVKDQRKVLSLSITVHYDPPSSRWRRWCFYLVRHKKFEYAIISCILLNMAGMTVTYSSQPVWMAQALSLLSRVCLVVFAAEAALKVAAYGPLYFGQGSNRFDFAVVLLTTVSELLPQNSSVSAGATVFRIFRVGRALRLINKAKLMRSLFNTVVVSLPSVGNVMGLLMLLYYIFAALGVQLFAKLNDGPEMVNSHQNFQTFWTAFQMLIGFSTGENWDTFMWEAYNVGCPNSGCASWLIVPYFYAFTLIVGYIGLNLFSAIIVDAIGDDGKSPITPEALEAFAAKWAEFDRLATGFIRIPELVVMLGQLPPPFGFKCVPGFTPRRIQKAIGDLRIPVYDRIWVHFKDVPRALVQRVLSQGSKSRFEEITELVQRLGIDNEFDLIWKRTHKKAEVLALAGREKTPVKLVVASRIIITFLRKVNHHRERRRRRSTVIETIALES
ncbi:hypothetical protein, variant [Aphanomyces invadans]|uniref:EF-hand domain-containing protein n=1 Tax=Aphanomyces invadans TaxID=157072 RepID=A0A024UV83_9STRA|nr:hypothetical protein, variant [Aphanomyces invadans]ETW09842.1 hypothetical protein, variant [Aphanomyces invadans]|eukprot:XP_008861253.1 hypothetical protein, variant [Aphanomyces invadans]